MKKISELTAATSILSTAVVPIVQNGDTEKATARQLAESAQALSYAKQVALGIIRLGG